MYDVVYMFTAFDNSCFSQSRDIIEGRKILNAPHDLDHGLARVTQWSKHSGIMCSRA